MQLTGIHHLTAITANVSENYRFYTGTLGMRLVKRSVNQDDVSAYHLFFADAVGSPGTDLTFFDWALPGEVRGTRSISKTNLRVSGASLNWWAARFDSLGVRHERIIERDGRLVLDFEDFEGQRLALLDDGGFGDPVHPWAQSPVPAEYQIRGLGPIVISVPDLGATERVLLQVMNMRADRQYVSPDEPHQTIHVYSMGAGGAHAELHVAPQPGLPTARQGAGGAHHVAFRTPTEEQYHQWTARLQELGIRSSGEIDRYYFRSLYFREPGGILFEIATDGPGFAVDEDAATLGEKVVLPPFLEPQRAAIIARLKPIEVD